MRLFDLFPKEFTLSITLLVAPVFTYGQFAISVLAPAGNWHCWDEPWQDFRLIVQNPTYPIVINWNNGAAVHTANNASEYEVYRNFEATGNVNSIVDVFVVVTNGTGEIKNASSFSSPIDPWGSYDDQFYHYPYNPGDPVRGYLNVGNTWTMDLSTGQGEPWEWLSVSYPGQSNPPGSVIGTWQALLGPGSVINAQGDNGCMGSSDGIDLLIGPPTILPSWMVLDVEGSCANGPTGSVTISTLDPVIGQVAGWGLTVVVRRASNNALMNTIQMPAQGGTATTGPLPADSYWISLRSGPYVQTDSVLVVVPSLGGTCGTVAGTVQVDIDQNCALGFSEPRVREAIIAVEPGPIYTTTRHDGTYRIRTLPLGAYTAEMLHPQVEAQCAPGPVPFSITGAVAPVSVDFPSQTNVPMDIELFLGSASARPGFEHHMNLAVRNQTPLPSGQLTISLTFDDGVLEFLSASPAAASISGNTATWLLPGLNGWGIRTIPVRFQVPADVGLLGTILNATATVETENTDGDLTNNTATSQTTITGAYDPNDKLARTSSGSEIWWVPDADEWIDYTIRFQNTGTDTAFNVLITDTLPAELDPASVRVGASSHRFSWSISGPGILKFAFPGIMLPDSNVNEPGSNGFVIFRIKVRQGMMTVPGDEVINTANIYFDFNPPIITEPCVLSVPYPEEQVLLDAQVFLSGVYDTVSGLMRDDLRAQGLLPTSEPYSALGYSFEGGGGETVSPAVLAPSGPTAIVDWVVVELRLAVAPTVVAASRAALLRRDGRVVDVDGVSPVAITVGSTFYFVVLRHRNHLPVFFDMGTFFQPAQSGDATTVDFTDPFAPTFGTDAQRQMGSVMALWPGDLDFNGTVKYTGAYNDRDIVLIAVGGSTPTNVLSGVYSSADVNMDGEVKYTGTGNDRDVILQTIGGVVPTAVRVEQIP